MLRKNKFLGFIVLVLSFVFILSSGTLNAQMSLETSVKINSGLEGNVNSSIEKRLFYLLKSVNEFSINEENQFGADQGVSKLLELIGSKKYISNLEEITTIAMEDQAGNYIIPGIYMKPIEGNEFSFEEFEFIFSEEAELMDVRVAEKEKSYKRILRRSSMANEEEVGQVTVFFESYKDAFKQMDLDALSLLFDEEATIITGSKKQDSDQIVYQRYSYETYLDRLRELKETAYRSANVTFDETEIYRHPDFSDMFGFYAKQYYNTPSYADTGFVFMIVNLEEMNPNIVSRTWQQEPVELSNVTEFEPPKPRRLEARLTDVRTRVDNSNVSLTKSIPREQGLLQIEIETNDLSLINATKVQEWIGEDIIMLSNLELLTDFAEIIDQNNIRIPFKVNLEPGMQRVQTELGIRETSVLDEYSSKQALYLQRLNIMTVRILSREEQEEEEEKERAIAAGEIEPDTTDSTDEYAFAEQFAFEGKVKFRTNKRNFNIRIIDEGDNVIFEEEQNSRRSEYQLLEGPYRVQFSGEGIETREINLTIVKTEILEHILVLR